MAIAINYCDPFVIKSSEHSYSGCSKIRDPHGTLSVRNVGILVIETTSPSSPSNGTESQRTPFSKLLERLDTQVLGVRSLGPVGDFLETRPLDFFFG